MVDPVARSVQPPSRAAAAANGERDWAAEATDTIVGWVDTVRSKTTVPALTVARAIVYGLLAGLLAAAAAVVGIVLLIRVLDAYLPDDWVGEHHVWVVYLGLGLLFSTAGLLLWTRRRPQPD